MIYLSEDLNYHHGNHDVVKNCNLYLFVNLNFQVNRKLLRIIPFQLSTAIGTLLEGVIIYTV